jgi:hypothetical protein
MEAKLGLSEGQSSSEHKITMVNNGTKNSKLSTANNTSGGSERNKVLNDVPQIEQRS